MHTNRGTTSILLAKLLKSPINIVSYWGVPVAKPEID